MPAGTAKLMPPSGSSVPEIVVKWPELSSVRTCTGFAMRSTGVSVLAVAWCARMFSVTVSVPALPAALSDVPSRHASPARQVIRLLQALVIATSDASTPARWNIVFIVCPFESRGCAVSQGFGRTVRGGRLTDECAA